MVKQSHGISDENIAEGTTILIEQAKTGKQITYAEFVSRLHSIRLEPQSDMLVALLGKISSIEHGSGRGMLSVLVVLKSSGKPGKGFFELARELGLRGDDDQIFVEQFNHVLETWQA